MSFQSLPHLLNSISSQDSWRSRQQFQQLVGCWLEVVGAAVAAQTRPIALQRQVLQVAASSSVWAQNLAFERHRIVAKLNARLNLGLTDIRFSTAHWRSEFSRNGVENSSEIAILWREHPSRVNRRSDLSLNLSPHLSPDLNSPTRYQTIAHDPQSAFRNWARAMRTQTQHLPLCPCCQAPAPAGELARWSVCSLCAAQQFGLNGAFSTPPATPEPDRPNLDHI